MAMSILFFKVWYTVQNVMCMSGLAMQWNCDKNKIKKIIKNKKCQNANETNSYINLILTK